MKPEHEKRWANVQTKARIYFGPGVGPGVASTPEFTTDILNDIPWLIERLREAEAEVAELDADWEYARERCTETCGRPRPDSGDDTPRKGAPSTARTHD